MLGSRTKLKMKSLLKMRKFPKKLLRQFQWRNRSPSPKKSAKMSSERKLMLKVPFKSLRKLPRRKQRSKKPSKSLSKRSKRERRPRKNQCKSNLSQKSTQRNLEPKNNEPIVIIQEPIKVKDVVTKINEGNRFDLLLPANKPESNPLPFSEEGKEIQASLTVESQTKSQPENITIEPKETPEKTLDLLGEPDGAQQGDNLLDYTSNPIEEKPRSSPIKESPTKQSPKKEGQTYKSPDKYAQFVDEEDQPKYSPSKSVEKRGTSFELTGITLNALEKQPKDETTTNSTQASFQQSLSDEMDKPLLEESKLRSDQDPEVHHRKNWTRLDVMDGENPNKRSKNCLESLCEKISKIFGYA